MAEALFVSWIGFHGRSAGIAEALGIECVFVTGGTGPAPLRYLRAWRETRALLRSRKPATVLVMQPPIPALLSVALHAPRRARIIGDLHTGVFTDPKWKWALGLTMRILRRRGCAVVTGETLAGEVRAKNVRAIRLHDMIEPPAGLDAAADSEVVAQLLTKPYVLVPLAYAFDEPVDELLEAARRTPEITWVLTGRAPAEVRQASGDNVVFPGFVTRDDYRRLVQHATVMAALTTQENTMQRVGYEALSESRALITSGTAVLREFFEDAALYIDPNAESIAAQATAAVADAEVLRRAMAGRREVLKAEQSADLEALRREVQR